MREEDLRKQAKALLKQLDDEISVIGTAITYTNQNNKSYLECFTLLSKNAKNKKKISNLIKYYIKIEPTLKIESSGFSTLTWQFLPQNET